jgi:cell pole-organizing protein PopZ
MGDVSAEPSMEDILSSIKRIIAEDVETGGASRARRRPTPQPTPVEAAEDDDVLELSEAMPESDAPSIAAPIAAVPAPAAPGEKIISDEAAEVSRARLASLSRLVIKPEVAGSDTLEGLVREMLKPMLRDWLDANLPDLVETMVAKEIARITGQR